MAKSVLVDSGFLVALLSRRDLHHPWAVEQARHSAGPWRSCEAVLSEAFHLFGLRGLSPVADLLRRQRLVADFDLIANLEPTLALMEKYADVPMSLADACLVRMSETYTQPVLLTTDSDFRIYRRHSRQVIPVIMP
jgi:predicted nucleic acid-binding protein